MSGPLLPKSWKQDVLDEKTMVDEARFYELTVDELKQYVAAGKDANCRDVYGNTALMMTARHGQTELTQMLLDANDDVNMQNNEGLTALHYAADYNHPSAIAQLIKARADVNIQDNDGSTALHAAFHRGYMACTVPLLDAKANLWIEAFGESPMSLGLQYHHSNDNMMRFLLEHGTCQDTEFTALMEAARQDYMPAVKKLLALGANVYEKDKYGTTALDVTSSEECAMLLRQHTMMSAPLPPPPELPEQDMLVEKTMVDKAYDNELTVDEAKQYIAAGKDVNYQNEDGTTALMMTASNGQTELAQMLLDANADVCMQNNDGWTALHCATANDHPSAVVQLINAGADVNTQNNYGTTALHSAFVCGHMTCALLLLDAKTNLWLENKDRHTPMSIGLLSQHSNDDMMRLLMEHGTCKDTGFTALMEASRHGSVLAVKKLLVLGANVHEKDKYGTTALDVASSSDCTWLLRQHTMMSTPLPPPPESPEQDVLDEKTMVKKAYDNELTVDEAKQYIAAGKDVNYQDKYGRTALMWTAGHGQTELTQMLLDANADVNKQNNEGLTALHYAADYNHPSAIAVIEQLIKARADVNIQDNDGSTALHAAFHRGYMACTVPLLDAKANLWIEAFGESPMSFGLRYHHSNDDMMRFLLEHGTCQDTGFTALMEASRRSYFHAVKKLLALGANVYEKDKYGTTALDVTSYGECTWLLRQHVR